LLNAFWWFSALHCLRQFGANVIVTQTIYEITRLILSLAHHPLRGFFSS
jgi:hypothetical protein